VSIGDTDGVGACVGIVDAVSLEGGGVGVELGVGEGLAISERVIVGEAVAACEESVGEGVADCI